MFKHYVVSLDYYTEDSGYFQEICCVTHSRRKAQSVFNEISRQCREIDDDGGWKVMDDNDTTYFSYNKMPEYCRVTLKNPLTGKQFEEIFGVRR